VTLQKTTIRGCGWSVFVRNVSATLGVDWRTTSITGRECALFR
jgi:hypothetical protein